MQSFDRITSLNFDELDRIAQTYKIHGWDADKIVEDLIKVVDTGAVNGLSADEMNAVSAALGRMGSTGRVDSVLTKTITDAGVNVNDILAEEYYGDTSDKSLAKVSDRMRKGGFDGKEVVEVLMGYMEENFSGAAAKQAETYLGSIAGREGAEEEVAEGYGAGYKDERIGGHRAQEEFLDGEAGQTLKEANIMIGKAKGELENLGEEYERDALLILQGADDMGIFSEASSETQKRLAEMQEEFKSAFEDGDGAALGKLYAEAENMAKIAYMESDGYMKELELKTELAQRMTDELAEHPEVIDANKRMGEAMAEQSGTSFIARMNEIIINAFADMTYGELGSLAPDEAKVGAKPYAYGLSRVPYNNFPANLHEGEAVLTGAEARKWRAGSMNSAVNITGNNFNVREEADIDKIATALSRKLKDAVSIQIGS